MTQNMKDIISNEYFMLALTFGVYYLAKTLQRRLGWEIGRASCRERV